MTLLQLAKTYNLLRLLTTATLRLTLLLLLTVALLMRTLQTTPLVT